MSSSNRVAILTKIHRLLKKRYQTFTPRSDQPVLESLLFACCLENTPYETAERVFEVVRTSYFDWNEVRVTTAKELAEVMHVLPDPLAAATQLKGVLQTTFESEYAFDLESIKKKNLGDAIKRLQKLEGASAFVIAFATQTSLSGHSIPIDRGALGVLYTLGAINEAEHAAHHVPGLERAIPKTKGVEFGSLIHEAGAEFVANPFSQPFRDFLLTIAPDAKDRFPKRVTKKAPEPVVEPPKPAAKKAAEPAPAATSNKKKGKEAPPPAKKPAAEPKKPAPAAKKKAPPAAPAKKAVANKTLAKRKPR